MTTNNTYNTGHNHGHSGHYASSGDYNYKPGSTHDFVAHADAMLGADILAEGQSQYGGYAYLGENTIIARSPITGLRPVIDQAIRQIVGNRTIEQAIQRYGSEEKLESKIANQLTNLNDWGQLQQETQNEIMIMTGINFDAMTAAQQEMTINHLQHSPLPFGNIEEVLSTRVKIDLGITHTLDKNKTEVEDLGDGVWKITMISNNNNGSHTGHNLGSFKVQLDGNADAAIAKQIGNSMVTNTNNNNALYLDQAARDVLYGRAEEIDFDHPEHDHSNTPGAGHSFVEHVKLMYDQTLISDQDSTGGFAELSDNYIVGRSTITGLQAVVEQAIQQIVGNRTVEQAAQRYGGHEQLENKIAQQITNLNDWQQLTEATQAKLMIQTGINFDGMTAAEQEKTINHLLHSPLPFGLINKVLSTSTKIDLGYTHTLDKNKTEVEDLGDGVWEITIISNNNNGSHTGHNLGSFRVQLGENADAAIAKQIGNSMIVNTNNNAKLYLDQAARDILYGNTDKAEYTVENPFQKSGGHNHGDLNHVHGTGADEALDGTDANDHIMGMGGVDVISGSAGDDIILGGAGDYNQVDYQGKVSDYKFTQNADGTVTVVKPNGTDTLTDIGGVWFTGDAVWYSIEQLIEGVVVDPTPPVVPGTGNNINGTEGDDFLFGTDADDIIDLGLGLDVVNGSAGSDIIKGGDSGYNQVDYDGSAADYSFTANADGSVTVVKPNGTDTLTDIGGVWFKGSNEWLSMEQLTAGSTPSTPVTTDGDDYVISTDGDDVYDGGAGTDVFRSSLGNDVFDGGGDEYDQVDYTGSRSDYTFVQQADGSVKVTSEAGTDTLIDIDGIWFEGDNEWSFLEDVIETEDAL